MVMVLLAIITCGWCNSLTTVSDSCTGVLAFEHGRFGCLSLSLSAPLGHTSVVTCLAAHSDNVLVLSGSEDSSAKLTNTNTGKVSGLK